MAADASSPPGGAHGRHPGQVSLPVLVAPTTGQGFNLLQLRLLPLACWRLEDLRFDFGSSLIKPGAEQEFSLLASLWHELGGPSLSVFGHADPVGDDEFNKVLSGRRAKAVYALLTRDTAKWEELYTHPLADDNWQRGAVAMMLARLGFPSVTSFQADRALPVDGIAGPKTRAALFSAYMDALCHEADGQPFGIEPGDFLAAGADPGGKGDYQGCGEFNPIMLFSREENQRLSAPGRKAERDAANSPNRRVLIFLFPVGASVAPGTWPCPRVAEGSGGCKAMFWPDGDQRRAFQERHREYTSDKDTFACAFYDGMARRSPCETVRKTLRIRLFDAQRNPIPDAPYRLTVLATGDVRQGTARSIGGEDGWLVEDNVLAPSRCRVEWGDPRLQKITPVPLVYHAKIFIDIKPEDVTEEGLSRRLRNLGYPPTEFLADSVRPFQRDYGLPETGELDDATRQAIIEACDHGKSRDQLAAGSGSSGA